MQFTIEKEMIGYVVAVLVEKNIHVFHVSCEEKECILDVNVSAEEMEKIVRIAWGKKETLKRAIPVLTREDIDNLRTGIIPKEEAAFFEQARL